MNTRSLLTLEGFFIDTVQTRAVEKSEQNSMTGWAARIKARSPAIGQTRTTGEHPTSTIQHRTNSLTFAKLFTPKN